MTIRKRSKNSSVGKLQPQYQDQKRGRSGLRKLVLYTLLTAAVAGVAWGLWVDFKIRSDFKALQWALPARIYARPAELYVGARLSAAEFTAYLQRLGYRQSTDVAGPGEYQASGSRVEVRTRGFEFWDGAEPSVYAQVAFDGSRVASLRGTGSQALSLMRMEPIEIAQINPETGEDRLPVTMDEVPEPLLHAIVAVEDHRFYEHFGVDVRGILRAFVTNLRQGEIVQGGSTLTQQLVKNLYLTRDRTIRRKVEEALMALSLELHFSKDEILQAYVNEVHLGQEGNRAIHGFALAARYYFGRPLNELSLDELAVLAGLPRGASYYNPLRHPERATQRRNVVLARMHEQGFISREQLDAASSATLEVAPETKRAGYPAFMDLVYADLASDYDANALRTIGLRIFTTLDVAMQDAMESTITSSIANVERRLAERGQASEGARLETAVVIADANNGDIRAVAGSREPGYTGFNRAMRASRPIGSLAKPAVYLAALESGRFNLASVLSDRPVEIPMPNGDVWRPGNFEDVMNGDVYLYDALERSMNLATVDLGMQVGLEQVASMISRLGHTKPVRPYPSLLLGAVNMVPVEVAQMYQTLASNGFRSPLRAVEAVTTSRGEPLARYGVATEQIANPSSVYLLEHAMQGSFTRGTARNSRNTLEDSLPLAGKTGTTNDTRDSWFAGYGDDLIGVVWMGHDDNRETGLTGSTGALRLWADIMDTLNVQPRQSLPPPDVEWQRVALDPAARSCIETQSLPFRIDLPADPAVSCEVKEGGSLIEQVFDRFRDWRN